MSGTHNLRLSIPVRSSRFLHWDTLTCVNTVPCCDMFSYNHLQVTVLCAYHHIQTREPPPPALAVSSSLSSIKTPLRNGRTTCSTNCHLPSNHNYIPPWIALSLVTAYHQCDSMAPPPCPPRYQHPPPPQQ